MIHLQFLCNLKVQIEVIQKRQKEKKEMLDAVKKYRKGQKDKLDFLNDLPGEKNKNQNKKNADKLRYIELSAFLKSILNPFYLSDDDVKMH